MRDGEEAENTEGPMINEVAMRQSARGVLEDEIDRAEQRLHALVALRNSIAWNALRPEVEESLWRYFSSRH